MGHYPKNFNLADNATTKDINAFKKRINWGEVPALFHTVSNNIADAEGFIDYGFDNAYKHITDRRNWNIHKLNGNERQSYTAPIITPNTRFLNKPTISIYHVFNNNGYELLAFPVVNGKEIDDYRKNDESLDFLVWDPSQMKVLVRLAHLHNFINLSVNIGDDADLALVIHAHLVVEKMISMLKQEVNVKEVKGMSIQRAYKLQHMNPHLPAQEIIIATQIEDETAEQKIDPV